MSATSLSADRFTSGIADLYYEPRIYDRKRPLVIFMGGGADTALNGFKNASALLTALVGQGYAVVMPSVPNLLGNATATSRIADALTWGKANLGVTSGAPILIGVSNGSVCAMQYARTNPVTAVIGILPVVDLNYARVNDIGSVRGLLDTAWSVTYPAALPSHADLWTDRALYSGVPMQMWMSTDDPFDAGTNKQSAFAAACGADARSLGAVGHSDTSVLSVDVPITVQFIKSRS